MYVIVQVLKKVITNTNNIVNKLINKSKVGGEPWEKFR